MNPRLGTALPGNRRLLGALAGVLWLAQPVAAQPTFSRDYDLPDRELSPRDQVEVSGGGFLVCGDAYLTGTQASRPYLLKLDAAGEVLWCREYRALEGFHRAEAILPLAEDLFVLLVDLSQVQQPALLAVDGSGNVLGAVGYRSGSTPLTLDDLTRTSDGGFLAVGSTFHADTGQDLFALKLGPLGQVEWSHERTGSIAAPQFGSNDFAVRAVEASGGRGYHVVGSVESDAYLALLGPTGAVEFERTYRLAGASVFERALNLVETPTGRRYVIGIGDLGNDRFPLPMEVDGTGALLGTTVTSFPMSATDAVPTSAGGFAISGSSLITPGAEGLRLAGFDAEASFQWAWQVDVTLSFATVNPPASLLQTGDGGFLVSIAAFSGFENVQRTVRFGPAGQLACASTPLDGPLLFEVESAVPAARAGGLSVTAHRLRFSKADLEVEASANCPAPLR